VGEVFAGRYELLELIGQGGMGSVWRVHDRRTDRSVAAKVLRQSDAASLLRFVRETAFRVQHPHVVTPLGWVGEDDRVLFTMPVVDGGSVSTLVGDHGPLPAPFVAEILRQLLDALAAVHASGIVHRDVKPANILLAATGSDRPHVYLTDFGIASELDGPRLTETHMALGTRGYMAPEQSRGELATASDLYAVGAVAGHMLTAQSPTGVGPSAFARPPGVPDPLWGLIMELLAAHPAQRPEALRLCALEARQLIQYHHVVGPGLPPDLLDQPGDVLAVDHVDVRICCQRCPALIGCADGNGAAEVLKVVPLADLVGPCVLRHALRGDDQHPRDLDHVVQQADRRQRGHGFA